MVDPASIKSQEEVENGLDAILAGVSLAVLAVITDRANKITSDTTLAEVLANYPEDMKRAQELLAAGQDTVDSYTVEVFAGMAVATDAMARKYYQHRGIKQTPISQGALKSTLDKGVEESIKTTASMMKTTVVGISDNGKFIPYQTAYKNILSEAVNAMAAGEATYEQVIAKSAKKLSESGLKVVYPGVYEKKVVHNDKVLYTYKAKREKPLVRNINGAVRMNIMDNYRQTLSALRKKQAEEFGYDGVEISAHGLCAPDHQEYQGQQMTKKEFENLQKSLPRPFEEMNCRHTISYIIMDIHKPAYSDEEIEKMNQLSNKDVTFTGLNGQERTMPRYEATQYQRQIERNIRSAKETLVLDPGNTQAKAAKKAYEAAYSHVCEKAELTPNKERTKAYIAR